MLTCPKCHQSIKAEAISCPYCNFTLKAFGHPGIPVSQAVENEYLCSDCIYHLDDSCNFPKRPYAKSCTLYNNQSLEDKESKSYPKTKFNLVKSIRIWCDRNKGLLIIVALIIVSVFLALQ